MQAGVSHDRVSTGKLEKGVVNGTTALKTNLTFREGLFPLRKKKEKLELPVAGNLNQLFVAEDIIFEATESSSCSLCVEQIKRFPLSDKYIRKSCNRNTVAAAVNGTASR